MRRHAGLGLCSACWQRHPDLPLVRAENLIAEVTQDPVVATYTRPGHRVLLLAPPIGPHIPIPDWATPGTRAEGGLLPALIEAAGTASRLGRTLEAVTAAADFDVRAAADAAAPWPQSVHRLPPESVHPAPTGHRLVRRRRRPTAVGPDRYDAVIALVDPHHPEWVPDVPWDSLLVPPGVLACITHSDHRRGRLIDPSGLVTRAARSAGLAPLDHVALLQLPVRDGALAPEPDMPAVLPTDDAPCAPAPWHIRVHADLLLFSRPRHAADHRREERR
ncbi:hypothetical protein QF026_005659 [Streptomyces aurantiacus]|uniref:hypothetical protein n=1 Tax=Streptomyces aurantiacus TaxID=47760 RepID=UPI0027949E8E|nr:hypothetical protein [Streptomyces aurantiacus]MDQ0777193.1 hypothetical protein [Streptomyces aurantiacus]